MDSPIPFSANATARFQRSRCCGWPLRNFERKSNWASTNFFDSSGASESVVWGGV
jgi:hypothetical protein